MTTIWLINPIFLFSRLQIIHELKIDTNEEIEAFINDKEKLQQVSLFLIMVTTATAQNAPHFYKHSQQFRYKLDQEIFFENAVPAIIYNKEDIIKLLEHIKLENKTVELSFLGHVIGLAQENGQISLYNSNYEQDQLFFDSLAKAAENIFEIASVLRKLYPAKDPDHNICLMNAKTFLMSKDENFNAIFDIIIENLPEAGLAFNEFKQDIEEMKDKKLNGEISDVTLAFFFKKKLESILNTSTSSTYDISNHLNDKI